MTGVAALVLCFGLSAPPAEAPRHYVLLFGGQADRYRLRTAHTWVTFVRAQGERLESFTISWLPERMPVRPCKLTPEPGRNYGLHETLDIFQTGRERINLWGPHEIRAEWYAEAAAHKARLDGGTVLYQVLDRGGLLRSSPLRHPELSHCVHAVCRTDEGLRVACTPVLGYGALITRKLAKDMTEVNLLVDPVTKHDWLLPVLDLERYPLKRRTIGEPLLAILR